MLLRRSTSGYAETTKRRIEAITSRGLTVFARIDHAAAASEWVWSSPRDTTLTRANATLEMMSGLLAELAAEVAR